jgi:hypothetical protein
LRAATDTAVRVSAHAAERAVVPVLPVAKCCPG